MSTLQSQSPSPARRWLRHGMLPQLAAFEAVMRLGSATRAAEALCMAQPTLSGHLRKLAEALGVRLFQIEGKRLVPTPAAHALLHATHEMFAALQRCDQLLAPLRCVPGSERAARVDRPDRPGAAPRPSRLDRAPAGRKPTVHLGPAAGQALCTALAAARRPVPAAHHAGP